MRQFEAARQAPDLTRFASCLRTQTVIDGDRDQARPARQLLRQRAASHIKATDPGRRIPQERSRERSSSRQTDALPLVPRSESYLDRA